MTKYAFKHTKHVIWVDTGQKKVMIIARVSKMISQLAVRITNFFVQSDVISEEEKEIYQYGNELIVSSLVDMSILAVAAVISQEYLSMVLFWIIFFALRSYGGGYHAKSHFKCKLVFIMNIMAILLVKIYLSSYLDTYSLVLLGIFSELVIFNLAPIENISKPVNETQKRQNGMTCKIISIIVIILALAFIPIDASISLIFILSLFSVAISMIAEIWEMRKHNER